jgi:hypothetical protein
MILFIYCFDDVRRPLWREVGSVICLNYCPSIVSKYIVLHVMHMLVIYIYIYTHNIYTRLLSVQAENSRSCSFLSSLGYNGSLVTWMVICLTTAKFKPPVPSVQEHSTTT